MRFVLPADKAMNPGDGASGALTPLIRGPCEADFPADSLCRFLLTSV